MYTWDVLVAHPEVTHLVGHLMGVDDFQFLPDSSQLLSRAGEEVFAWNLQTGNMILCPLDHWDPWNDYVKRVMQPVSRTGNMIPRYCAPMIEATEDNWLIMILPDHGGQRCLFKVPSKYQLHEPLSVSMSWMLKRIFIGCRNKNCLIVDVSALLAAMIDFTS